MICCAKLIIFLIVVISFLFYEKKRANQFLPVFFSFFPPGILVLLLVNATIGFIEDKSAADAVEALKGALAPKAKAKRGGRWEVPTPAR